MSDDDKTRIIAKKRPSNPVAAPPKPVVVNGKIVFHCPQGHRLAVSVAHAGKRGRCDRPGCNAELVIPTPEDLPEAVAEAIPEAVPDVTLEIPTLGLPGGDMAAAVDAPEQPAAGQPGTGGEVVENQPAAGEPGWNFDVGGDPAGGAVTAPRAWGEEGSEPDGPEHPTARLTARLWAERDHGGIVELHLTGGSVIVPEWYETRWSRGTHGLFASPGPNNSVTLTAVAWDTVQKIVVRQLPTVPDDMFE